MSEDSELDLSSVETAKLAEELEKRDDNPNYVFQASKQAYSPRPRGKHERN
jgi:hypothetical protein